jgi:hypothetical protein
MFGFLKLWKKTPVEPPTKKQLGYAKKLGVTVTPKMSKADVSAIISEAERANPKLRQQREHVKQSQRERKYGPELIEAERKWNELSDQVRYILAVYRKGKETIVDVLDCGDADINERGKLILNASLPKVVNDPHLGKILEWDKTLTLPVDDIRHYEPLHPNFHDEEIEGYQRAVERGLKIARKL